MRFFAPADRRGDRRDREARQRRPHRPLEPDQQPVRRHGLPGQPEAAQRAGHQGLPEHRRRARAGRPGGHRHAGADRARRHRRVRRRPASRARSSSRPASRRSGRQGVELERQVLDEARRGTDAHHRPELPGRDEPAHAASTPPSPRAWPGRAASAFISQSGALCTAILDWSLRENVGFSAFVSIGSMLDVGWGDLIDYLGDDPHTKSIVIYMESIGDARSFLSAAREVALTKPIIVIKAGPHRGGGQGRGLAHRLARPAATRCSTPPSAAAACCASTRIADVFYMAEVLAKQPRPQGPAADDRHQRRRPRRARDRRADRAAAASSPSSRRRRSRRSTPSCPPHWSHDNPIDILGDADPERYAKALEIAAKDPNSDGLLVILTPQAMTDPTRDRRAARAATRRIEGKPRPGELDGRRRRRGGRGDPEPGRHPDLPLPRHRRPRLQLHVAVQPTTCAASTRRPTLPDDATTATAAAQPRRGDHRRGARERAARSSPRSSRSSCWPPTASRPSRPESPATSRGRGRGGRRRSAIPVVLKLHSETITHKTDVGGVQLTCATPTRCAAPSTRSRRRSREQAGAEHFQGVTVQPMVKPRRLRADPRQQPRPAVRPGAPVRRRRAARRGLQGPRARRCRR